MIRLALVNILLVIFLVGCGTKSTVVLRPNPYGAVGEIEVTSETGSQRLTEPNQVTQVKTPKAEPTAPKTLSETEIQESFSEVLAIQPMTPAKFILYFEFDSNELTAESQSMLPEIFATIHERQSVEISVSGHSDRMGAKDYNIQLSLKRAKIVGKKLVSMGVNPDYIDVSSHGEGNPIIKTADNVSEPKNRRVEVVVR